MTRHVLIRVAASIATVIAVLGWPAVAAAQLVVAPASGGDPQVHVIDGTVTRTLQAYDPRFLGGVSATLGDVNGDGTLDIITGAGPTGGPHVRVFSGTDLSELASFYAYDPAFTGGVSVAAGDLDGDGRAEVITGAGPGGGPHVRAFSIATTPIEVASFYAYDPAFTGGVSVAAGDVNGDGLSDIMTGAGPTGGPHVRVFSGTDLTELASFYAYDPAFTGGVRVAAGDINGDGLSDIITGAGPTGGPHVRVITGTTTPTELASFYAFDPTFTGGVYVATGDINADGRVDLILGAGAGPGIGPLVRILNGTDLSELMSFTAPTTGGGVSVGSMGDLGVRFTSATSTTLVSGSAGTFTVTTAGFPVRLAPRLTVSGSLPAGVTFVDNGDGTATLAGTPGAGTGGDYTLTFTATIGLGAPRTRSFTLTVTEAPAITSADATTFASGLAGSFTVTTTASPRPTITATGTLPTGVTFVDNGDGTATLAGTPDAGTDGTYPLTFTAINDVGAPATQAFTLTVSAPQAPAITSASATTFTVGAAGSFTVTTTGAPAPALTVGGASLPLGVAFVDNGNGTGTLAGTPPAGADGIYAITFTAANGIGSPAVQSFTLTVNQGPAMTSANAVSFVVGSPGTFTVTTTGFPAPALAQGGAALPAGVTFVDNGNGTGTLSGTPAAGTSGVYAITFTATNGVGLPVTQAFTLTVLLAPTITSANTTTFRVGTPGSFTVTTTAFPPPSLTLGGASLPAGVTFVDNGTGTGSLSGTPAAGTGGTYAITFTASNGAGVPVVQPFTLIIGDVPALDLDLDDDGGTPPTPGNDFAITYAESSPPQFIQDEVDATITDVDSPTLTSITVTMTNVLDALQEKLDVDLVTGGFDANFTKTFDESTPGVAVLTITATTPQPLADFNTLLRRVTYQNLDIGPDATAPRTITFVVNDGVGDSNTATTTVTIVAVDQPPTADNDSYSVAEGGTLTVPAPGVLDGDTDPEGDTPITAVIETGPANASAFTLNSDGSFTYTHDGSNTTTDSFTYRAVANGQQSAPATVTITITAVNDPPSIAAGGTLNFAEGNPATAIDTTIVVIDDDTNLQSATVQIAANYVTGQDVLAMPVTAGIASSFDALTGTLTLTGSAPAADYQNALRTVTYVNGSDAPSPLPRTVIWIVHDGASPSNAATSTITVTPVNDLPVAFPDSGTTDEDTVLNVAAPGVLGNDIDPDVVDIRIVTAVNGVPGNVGTPVTLASGAVVTVNADGSYVYDPSGVAAFQALGQGQSATDTFDYTMQDGGALPASATVTITITGVNDLPALDLDADDDGGSPPTTGNDFAITYPESSPPQFIQDEVDATITDVDSPTLTSITVTITNVLDALQEKLDVDLVTGGFDANFTKSFDETTTPGVAVLTITATTPQSLADFNTLLRRVTYQNLDIGPDATAPRTITFVVNDGVGDSNTATTAVTIVAVDQPPTADNDSYTVSEGGTLTVPAPGVLDGDTDPEGDTPITAVIETGPANASAFTLNSDGSFTYTHNGSETTTDSFTYRAVANGLQSAPATVTITITAVNDAPAITAGGTLNFIEGNLATAIDTTILVTDLDDTNLESATVQIAVNYVNGQDILAMPVTAGIASSFNALTGTLTLTGSATVAAYQSALRSVTYFNNSGTPSIAPRTVAWVVNDGTVSSNIAASTITVTAVNSSPIGVTDAWTTFGNTELVVDQAGPATPFIADTTTTTFGVLDNDTDPEGDARVVTGIAGCVDTTAPFICGTAAGGSVTMESNGRFTYRPQAGDTGADSFQYVLTDVPSSGVPGSVNVTVNLTLQERIWYVDGDVAGPGTGTSNDPFSALPATAGDADDYVFVHDSTLTSGITLQNGQKLYGEAFGLSINQSLNGNPAPAVLVAPGGAPDIAASTGNAVGVLANSANGSLTSVEIRGLTLATTAASANAIDITSADAANVAVTISGVVVTGATAEGIDINQNSSGSATVSMTNVTVTSTGTGIDLNESAGTLTVTSFNGITIAGNTGGSGIVVTNATFDATAGGAYNPVAGGATAVGDAGNPVGGAGVVLTNVSGDLAFTDLDIFTTNGAGLLVSGTGAVNVGAGTGTRVTVASGVGTLQSIGGPVLNITNATVDLPLDTASVTSSPTTGISLMNVASGTTAASVSATSGSIANTTGISVNVSGGTVSLTYGGNITQPNNVAMVSVSGGHTTGTITFSGTLNATNGPGLVFDNADSTTSYTFTGTTTLNGGDAGIDILNGSAGTFSFGTGTTITNPSGTAFLLSSSNANVTYSGSISDNTGFAVDISGHAAGTVTFQTGSITSTGNGLQVSNNTGGTINFNSPTIALTTGANKAVTLDVGNAGGTINLAPAGGNGLDISTTTGIGFSALGGGTISVSGAGNTINSTGAMAIELQGVTIGAGGVNFATTTSGGGTRNVKLTSVTGGTIALGGGTLAGATGAAFLVGDGAGGASTGGTSAITYSGTITSTGTARAVDIQDRAAGAGNITLSGTITHSSGNANVIFLDGNAAGTIAFSGANSVLNGGTSTAVSLTNNTGATISFTGGGLNIDATGVAGGGFVATGGGTVNVTGTGNTIDTTSSAALNVTSTTIGASGMTFQSISANGATNGILLNNTGGTGSLTVAGNGGTCTSSATCTGGAILNATVGISLTSTTSPSFDRMFIQNTIDSGVKGTTVTNFTFTNGRIDNSGTGGGPETSNIAFNTTAAGTENNLSGSVTITGNTLTTAFYHGIDIFNFNGTIASATISNNTITSTTSTATSKGGGIRFIAFGSATTIANVTVANITNNVVSNFPSGWGIQAQGGNGNLAGPAGVFGTAGHATNKITITGNRLTGNPKFGTFAIVTAVNGRGQGNFDISSNGTVANPITNSIGTAISVGSFGFANVTAAINNNRIVANNQAGAQGIGAGTSATLSATETPNLEVTITNNTISATDGNGILVTARDATGTVRAKIQNNTVAAPLSGNRNGIRLDAGNGISVSDSLCANVSGNTSAGVGLTPEGIGLRKQGSSAGVNNLAFHGLATSPATEAQVATFMNTQNPNANGTFFITTTSNYNSPTCSFP